MIVLRDTLIYGLITSSIIAVGSVAFTLQFGISNIINLAFGAIMTLSAFTLYGLASSAIGTAGAIVAALAVGAVSSLATYRLFCRPFIRRGSQVFELAMVTIALGLIIQYAIESFNRGVPVALDLHVHGIVNIFGLYISVIDIGIVLVAILSLLLVGGILKFTRLGMAMRATSENPDVARACGIRTETIRSITWLISGILTAIAGIVLGLSYGTINPGFGTDFIFVITAAVIFGGIGRPAGALLGALVLGIVSEFVAQVGPPIYKDVVSFAVIVLVMLIRPTGLLGASAGFRRIRD